MNQPRYHPSYYHNEAHNPLVYCAAFRHQMPLSVRNREEPCPKCAKERGETAS